MGAADLFTTLSRSGSAEQKPLQFVSAGASAQNRVLDQEIIEEKYNSRGQASTIVVDMTEQLRTYIRERLLNIE